MVEYLKSYELLQVVMTFRFKKAVWFKDRLIEIIRTLNFSRYLYKLKQFSVKS